MYSCAVMKMVKSHTQRKSDNYAEQYKQGIAAATNYIKQWTIHELTELHKSGNPVCIPTDNGYKIGLYSLKVHTNKYCDLYNPAGDLVHTFKDKVSAIIYTVYSIKKRYKQADKVLALDIEINKNYTDIQTMRKTMESARKNKDYVSLDVRKARIDVAEKKLNLANEEMQNLHLTAKINKVWL